MYIIYNYMYNIVHFCYVKKLLIHVFLRKYWIYSEKKIQRILVVQELCFKQLLLCSTIYTSATVHLNVGMHEIQMYMYVLTSSPLTPFPPTKPPPSLSISSNFCMIIWSFAAGSPFFVRSILTLVPTCWYISTKQFKDAALTWALASPIRSQILPTNFDTDIWPAPKLARKSPKKKSAIKFNCLP